MLKKDEQYKIIDDYLSISNYEQIRNYVQDATYKHGEVDYVGSYSIGMVHELPINKELNFPTHINNYPLVRAYINFYSPRELAVFHVDADDPQSTTLLYYPCPTYELNEGGATELVINNNIVGVRSIANRLLAFKSNILHRSTPFKSYPRWTIALKYNEFITPQDERTRQV